MVISLQAFRAEKDRKVFHRAFNQWLCKAPDAEIEQFGGLREELAPNAVCSAIRLSRRCLSHPELASRMPPLLRQLLQARNWPLVSCGAQASEVGAGRRARPALPAAPSSPRG